MGKTMIFNLKGNILTQKTDVIVNPVNCVGVMGKGLALQMKKKFPEMFRVYKELCRKGEILPGKITFYSTGGGFPNHIFFFPTKDHWRHPSKLEYIEKGLEDLMRLLTFLEEPSISIPALGCGEGGLDWSTVRPLIENAFQNYSSTVFLFEP